MFKQLFRSKKSVPSDPDAHELCEVELEGGVIRMESIVGGQLVSIDDQPAVTIIDGAHTIYEWWQNNMLHRDNGPARIEVDDGAVVRQEYYCRGVLHRRRKPAVLTTERRQWWYRGQLVSESFWPKIEIHLTKKCTRNIMAALRRSNLR